MDALREQFEKWIRNKHPVWFSHQIYDDTIRIKQLWEAFQAGHAANADLLEACELVQQWWICYGMHRFRDEPAAIRKVHDAIKGARGE